MTVAAQDDAGIGPVLLDTPVQPADMAGDLGAGWHLAGAEQHRHRPPGRGVVDVERQEAALAVVTIPERQLLAAVDDIDRLVDVERHRRRRDRIAGAIKVDHDVHHPHQFARRRGILPAAHRRLAGKTDGAAGQLAGRQLEARVVAQMIEIIGILIAAGDRQDPRLQDVGNTVDDTALVAGVGNTARQAPGNAHHALRLGQQQHAAIRCQPPAIERRRHLLAANRWESEPGNAILGHGRRGTFCPGSEGRLSNHSLHQISRLSYARQPEIAHPVNKTG